MALHTEQTLTITLPSQYRDFLMNTNGGEFDKCISHKIIELDGADIEYFLRDKKIDNIPTVVEKSMMGRFLYPFDSIPIAYDMGGGVFLIRVLGKRQGEIIYKQNWEIAESGQYPEGEDRIVADSFSGFFDALDLPENIEDF